LFIFDLFRSFLPLHNPIGFAAADFIEAAFLLLIAALLLAARSRAGRVACALAERPGWCMLVLGLLARRVLIACPLRVVPVWITQFERHVGIPVITVTLDEDTGSVARKTELAAEKMKLAQARGVARGVREILRGKATRTLGE